MKEFRSNPDAYTTFVEKEDVQSYLKYVEPSGRCGSEADVQAAVNAYKNIKVEIIQIVNGQLK